MKTAFAALLALGLLAGQASARTAFDNLADSAPRGDVFSDIRASAPRSAFDALRDSAPRSVLDDIRDSAPRSDGVFGTLEQAAP
ncbi:MAG: hypothetical protein AB7O57_08005 [Hyphomicrobiaceae bacterium]